MSLMSIVFNKNDLKIDFSKSVHNGDNTKFISLLLYF